MYLISEHTVPTMAEFPALNSSPGSTSDNSRQSSRSVGEYTLDYTERYSYIKLYREITFDKIDRPSHMSHYHFI